MEGKNSKPTLLVKQKNIQLVFDYCLDNKIKFNVAPRLTHDEWEVELNIEDIMSAIALGVFVRENRIDVIGLNYGAPKAQAVASKVVKNTKAATKRTELIDDSVSQIGLTVDSNELLTDEAVENPVILNGKTELAF